MKVIEKTKFHIQLQYEGYLNTPQLWSGHSIFEISQLLLPKKSTTIFNGKAKNLRLGKLVERFVCHELNQHASIDVISENIQIQDGTTTIGEIDCLLKHNNKHIHLEIVYKFYLYDPSVGTDELSHWIGPNRRDSLHQKLTKLKEKQLPLLYRNETSPYLNVLNINPDKIQQRVLYKAQLFVPLALKHQTFNVINNKCINGFYMKFHELDQFRKCKFYIPIKLDWLVPIQTQINWLSFEQFTSKITVFMKEKSAPLCWLKHPNGEFEKCFVVWW